MLRTNSSFAFITFVGVSSSVFLIITNESTRLFFVSIACFNVRNQLNVVEFDDAPGVDARLDVGVTDRLGGAGVVALLDGFDDEDDE